MKSCSLAYNRHGTRDIHIEGITLGAGEEVDEVAGRASGMDVDRIGEVGDQAAGVYVVGFTAGSLARKGVKDGTRGMGIRLVLPRS